MIKTLADYGARVKATQHARERAELYRLSFKKFMWLALSSFEEKLPDDMREKKIAKWGYAALSFRNGPYIFSIKKTPDRETGEDIYLILTIFDQQLDIDTPKIKKHIRR